MPADCCKELWDKVKDTDEPVFTLRAQDKIAPLVIREWLKRAALLGVSKDKIDKGIEHLDAMEKWQVEHPKKVKTPD